MLAVTQIDPSISSIPFPALPQAGASAPAASAASAPASHSGFTFHDFLSIINPLQHLPVISTIYRAVTGDQIGVPEKIAGDALYGGVWGAVASVADAAFQAVTGKDFGDTVLAFFTGSHDSNTAVASNANASSSAGIVPVSVAPSPNLPADPNVAALTASLQQKGVDTTLAQRAILAYQKSMTLPDMTLPNMALATP
jgi:hypothetical protein